MGDRPFDDLVFLVYAAVFKNWLGIFPRCIVLAGNFCFYYQCQSELIGFLMMKYQFQGKSYRSISACYCDNRNKVTVTLATIYNRVRSGWDLEKAMLAPKQKTVESKLGSHTVEGVVYENLPSIAEEYGISLNTIYKRYSRGKRGDELIPAKKRKNYVKTVNGPVCHFIAGGRKYKSAAEACREHKVKYVTYRSRIAKGMTIEQALGIEKVPDARVTRGRKYQLNGRQYSIRELSQEFCVPEQTVRDRLDRGATVRQAVGLDEIKRKQLMPRKTGKRKRQAIYLDVDGKIYQSYEALAKDYDLPGYVVRQRIVEYGYSPKEAVTANGKSKPVSLSGKKYKSYAKLAEAFGLTLEQLLARLNAGRSLEEAVGLVQYDTSTTVTFNGVKYRSLKELALAYEISPTALSGRLSRGMTLEEAISANKVIRNPGRYNKTILSRDPGLASKPALLYFVSIQIEGKRRYKIGITVASVDARLRQEQIDYEVIKVVEGTLVRCFSLEQELLNMLGDKRDKSITSAHLDGYSEVLDLSAEDVCQVLDLLESYKDEQVE